MGYGTGKVDSCSGKCWGLSLSCIYLAFILHPFVLHFSAKSGVPDRKKGNKWCSPEVYKGSVDAF